MNCSRYGSCLEPAGWCWYEVCVASQADTAAGWVQHDSTSNAAFSRPKCSAAVGEKQTADTVGSSKCGGQMTS